MLRILSSLFFFCASLTIIIVFCANLGVYISAEPYIYASLYETPNTQTALVLGVSPIAKRELHPLFVERLDTAIHFFEEKKATRIVVSGIGHETVESEVSEAYKYLISKGIPEEAIHLDYSGFDTYTSLWNAKQKFEVTSVLIATQEFHLPRSIFISRMMGIEAHGLSTPTEEMLLKSRSREAFATVKSIYDLVTKRDPSLDQ